MVVKNIIFDLILAGILGGILHMDRTCAFQLLISRPIVVSSIIGAALGDFTIGLKSGMILEILWLGIQPLGTSIPPDDTLIAVAVPAGVIISGQILGISEWISENAIIALGVLIAIPLSWAGRIVDIRVRRSNSKLQKKAKFAANMGDIGMVERQNILGLISFFSCFIFISFFGVMFNTLLTCLFYPLLTQKLIKALSLIYILLPFFGAAALLSSREGLLKFGAAYVVSYVVFFIVIGVYF